MDREYFVFYSAWSFWYAKISLFSQFTEKTELIDNWLITDW
jgi:hypothetical protein